VVYEAVHASYVLSRKDTMKILGGQKFFRWSRYDACWWL